MTAAVYPFPAAAQAAPQAPVDLNLSEAEVQAASGGYKRAADQLRELHARGFVRAYIPRVGRKRVVLERAHHDAVVRGQFGAQQQTQAVPPPPAVPDRAGLTRFLDQKRKK